MAKGSRRWKMTWKSSHARPIPSLKVMSVSTGPRHGKSLILRQHPLQMLLIFRSTSEFREVSERIRSSPCIEGPGVTVPSIRPLLVPPAGFPARPTVVDPRGPAPLD
ncbi:hypothetical protein JQ543_05670 [Bradyrhizobium diazoefficiens]|nr:hypothetical protein [Bradyrhizobium diazoefficiens]